MQEVKSIEECLAEDFEKVILCSPERRTLAGVNALVAERIGRADQAKVLMSTGA
jgi:hypothetical protein